tara:strand:- start:511 stop:1155 length:645 start_codon:yes stop_codon:yes gene_type:complete
LENIKINNFESNINYVFSDKKLLIKALSHSSLVEKHDSYELMEFLGDSILNFVVTKYLFKKYNKLNEGKLTEKKSRLINSKTLSKVANEINLKNNIRIGKSLEKITNNIISDCYEALVAAIYLDSNFKNAEQFIKKSLLNNSFCFETEMNYKGKLLEICIQKKISKPIFDTRFLEKNIFETRIEIKSLNIINYATGKSIKQAEKRASKKILQFI